MHESEILKSIVVLFGTALVTAWAFRRLMAPSIIGFLFAGLMIGPSGLGFVRADDVEQLTELGLVMLLFMIGLELSPKPLLRMGWRLLSATGIQLFLVTAVTAGVLAVGGVRDLRTFVILGVAVSLSSTAIVLKQLHDRGETNTVSGTIATGVLLLQDVVVIVVMMFLPLLAAGEGDDWREPAWRSGVGLLGLGLLAVFGRRVLMFVLDAVVRVGGREMTALFAVLMACGGAWLAGLVDWSPALGACVAGLLLADADARHQLVADIMPFRDVFNALFFVSLGMLVDANLLASHPVTFLLAIGATLLVKSVLMGGAIAVSGWPIRPALHTGVLLCTVSEFGYVLGHEAAKLGLIAADQLTFLTVYAVGTMLAGAGLIPVAGPLSERISAWTGAAPEATRDAESHHGYSGHVVVVGYGVNGQNLMRVLKATGIPHCLVEMNPRLVTMARAQDVPVVVGDATRETILTHAGIQAAHVLVVAINDAEATKRTVRQARRLHPNLYILARTRFESELDDLYRLGADQVIAEDFETSIEIGAYVLREMDIPDNIVEAQIAALRAGRYGMLRGKATDRAAQEELMKVLQSTATRNHYLTSGSYACGKTIAQLDLRAATGVTIIAVVRNGVPATNPRPDFQLSEGDILVLVGAHGQLEAAKALLQAPPGSAGHA